MEPQDRRGETACQSAAGGLHRRRPVSLAAALAVRKPWERQPAPQLPCFPAPVGAEHRDGRPTQAGSFNSDDPYKAVPLSPIIQRRNWVSPWHHPAPTAADLVELCLETLRQKRCSPFEGLISQIPARVGIVRGTTGRGHSEGGDRGRGG